MEFEIFHRDKAYNLSVFKDSLTAHLISETLNKKRRF